MIKPLSGFRILDVTNVLSGPFCAYQLGLLGAEIIKIEAPDGDLARQLGANREWNHAGMGVSFLAQNAGKRSIAINLKDERGKAVFRRLLQTADAVIENFRPGVMDRLGLGFAQCNKVKEPIVYCAISGFGQKGPMSDQPAYDQIIQGLSGVMRITGSEESGPFRVGYPIADTIGGLTAALAVAAALHQKTSQFIDVSMLESVLTTMGWVVSNLLMHHAIPQPMGNENFTSAPSGTFRTRDGLLNIAANQQKQWHTLCQLLNRPDLVEDQRFATREQRKKNRALLHSLLEEILVTHTAAHWAAKLSNAGIPAGMVLGVDQALGLAQLRQRNFVTSLDQQGAPAASIDLVTTGYLINQQRLTPASAVEQLGASADAILRQTDFSPAEIAQLRADGVIG